MKKSKISGVILAAAIASSLTMAGCATDTESLDKPQNVNTWVCLKNDQDQYVLHLSYTDLSMGVRYYSLCGAKEDQFTICFTKPSEETYDYVCETCAKLSKKADEEFRLD